MRNRHFSPPTTVALGRLQPRRVARNPRGGKPAFRPSSEQRHTVEALAGFGLTREQIAGVTINRATGRPISPTTLEKHFRSELDRGRLKANVQVAQSLFRQATGHGRGAVRAAIFWSRARMGWRGDHLRGEATPVHEVAPRVDAVDAKEKLRRLIERERISRSEEEGKP